MVDALPLVMDALRDQSVTTHGTTPFQAQAAAPEARLPMRVPKRRMDGKPAAVVRSGATSSSRSGAATRSNAPAATAR